MTPRLRLVAATLPLLLFLAGAAFAQTSKHDSQLKTVRGVVTDKSDNPIPAGVVFLKNIRSNQVRSYIADDQGNYRFSGRPGSQCRLRIARGKRWREIPDSQCLEL